MLTKREQLRLERNQRERTRIRCLHDFWTAFDHIVNKNRHPQIETHLKDTWGKQSYDRYKRADRNRVLADRLERMRSGKPLNEGVKRGGKLKI
ncbi:MAG: hypothetical protein ACOC29_03310 [Candidatus Sumerlaeota bacterium]